MQRGPKAIPKKDKIASGTYQPCRDKPKHLILDVPAPVMPGYLPLDAQKIWHEEVHRVVLAGTNNLDSSFFADYCCLAALVRAKFQTGDEPRAAQLSELRKMRELLGIGGAPSRAQRGIASVSNGHPGNPFTALPEA